MDTDFNNEDLNSALKRAFIFYLDFLQHTQRSREVSLPRHGKGVETTVDAFTEQGLQSQEAATRVCIQYSDRIANNIREWMVSNIGGEVDTTEDEGRENTTLNVGVGDVLDGFSEYIKIERDFIDPFSGKLIQPTTPFSAGPSRDYESGIATSQTSLTHQASGENNNLSSHNDSQARAKITVHDTKASPLTITVPSDEDVFSESSTQFYSAVATPQLATPPHHSEISLDFTPTYTTTVDEDAIMTKRHCSRRATSSVTDRETVPDMFSDDMIAALELQVALDAEDEELRHQFQFALTLQDESASSTYSTISRFEMHRLESQAFPHDEADHSFKRQQNDIDLEIVQHLQEGEERRAHEVEREVAEVKWLQELWENEDVEFIQQEELTQETLRLEEERAMRIRADILLAREAERIWEEEEKAEFEQQEEFAREIVRAEEDRVRGIQDDIQAAQRAQSQWEREMKKQEEEQARLDAEEAKRVAARIAEEEKRARIEKEEKRREQENIANELRRKKEREESEKRARQADCASCMEAGERSEMAILLCKHAYCGDCIAGAFKTASSSKKEFKCCGTTVPVQLASRWLDSAFITSYETLLLERSTPNPRYCSNKSCGKFIQPQHIHGPVCICQACSTRTCKICGNGEHAGVCAEDKDGKKVQDLAQQNGWKTCGTCGQILERTEGCLHMTCRCGAHWCYNCLREWSSCNSTCQR